eukprot:Rmarinus@m.14333
MSASRIPIPESRIPARSKKTGPRPRSSPKNTFNVESEDSDPDADFQDAVTHPGHIPQSSEAPISLKYKVKRVPRKTVNTCVAQGKKDVSCFDFLSRSLRASRSPSPTLRANEVVDLGGEDDDDDDDALPM